MSPAEQAWEQYRDKAMREEYFATLGSLTPSNEAEDRCFRRVGRRLRKREFLAGYEAAQQAARRPLIPED